MTLNIKNDETDRLARALADLTGETVTAAVTEALRQRLDHERKRRRGENRLEALLAIAADCASRFKEPDKSIDHAVLLYDEMGLPKHDHR